MSLVAPFPYFGGKRTVAPDVWKRLGAPDQYIEPFCGSAAMLLAEWSRGRLTYGGGKTTDQECIWYSPACAPREMRDLFAA